MKVKNLFIPLDIMKAILLGNAEIDWLSYPRGTKIHRIVYTKDKNGYYICVHHKSFADLDIVEYHKKNIPEEDAMVRPIPGLPVQFTMFLQMMFPVLLQDYAQIHSKMKTKSIQEQNNTMRGLYKLRIGQYFDQISDFQKDYQEQEAAANDEG